MEALWNVIGKINTALWSNPMLFLALGSGLIFTICLRFVQVRKLKTMVGLLFNGKASDHGLSSFQAFTLAIAGRVGTGNIVGVATAICAGGPGALFWMWMIAIVGSATTFVECTLSQLHKKKIDGEYKGGWVYYIGDKWKVIGGICSVLFIATLAFTQTLVHSNAMSTALTNAFGIPPIVCGIVIAVILGAIVFGGVKVIARVAEPSRKEVYTERFGLEGAYITKATVQLMRDFGATPAPMNAYLLNVGLETLHLRMPQHCANALAVAKFVQKHPKIAWVNYPGLEGDKYHDLAQKYMPKGTCGVVTFGVKGGRKAAETFMAGLKLASIATHVADAKTCVLHPASSTHRQLSEAELAAAGVSADLIRLSVGIEDITDILADLEQALDQV